MRSRSSNFIEATNERVRDSFPKENFTDYDFKYLAYGIIGGFYFSPIFNGQMKRIWIGINIITNGIVLLEATGFMIGPYIGFNVAMDQSSLTFFFCLVQCSFFVLFNTCVAYYFRKELETALFLNEYLDKQLEQRDDVKHISKIIFNVTILGYALTILSLLIHIVYVLSIATTPDVFQDMRLQYCPHPLAPLLQNGLQFVCVSVVVYLPVFQALNVAIIDTTFLVVTIREYYIAFVPLMIHLEKFSEDCSNNFEITNKQFLDTDGICGMETSDYRKLLEAERQHMMENIESVIRGYQQYKRHIQRIKFYLEFKYSMGTLFHVCTMLGIITTLGFSDHLLIVQQYRGIILLIFCTGTWFSYSYSGAVFTNVGEIMAEHTYNIPWYQLDTRRRKVYYIFLCETQRPFVFRAFRIFDAGMATYQRVLNLCYTYFNFLRTVRR